MVASAGVSRSLKFKEGKYEVAILWKNDRTLPSNYNAAFKRLDNIENRLIRQPKLDGKYCKIIEDYINKGYLEYLDNKERTDNGWFLPYFLSIPISWQVDNKSKESVWWLCEMWREISKWCHSSSKKASARFDECTFEI